MGWKSPHDFWQFGTFSWALSTFGDFRPDRAGVLATAGPTVLYAPMTIATLYTTAICPYCVAAKNYLRSKGIAYEEVRIDLDPLRREEMLTKTRRTSVPQIFFGEVHVGGYDELVAADRSGRLAQIVTGEGS